MLCLMKHKSARYLTLFMAVVFAFSLLTGFLSEDTPDDQKSQPGGEHVVDDYVSAPAEPPNGDGIGDPDSEPSDQDPAVDPPDNENENGEEPGEPEQEEPEPDEPNDFDAVFIDITPLGVGVESPVPGSGLTWRVDGSTLTISYSGTGSRVMPNYDQGGTNWAPWYGYRSPQIPPNPNPITQVVISPGVSTIGDYAFIGFGEMINLTLPSSVTSIGSMAFNNNSNLETIFNSNQTTDNNLSNVTSIGGSAFGGCSKLNNITLSNNMTTINDGVFRGAAFNSIVIPPNVTSIGSGAFQGTGLISIVIPDSVVSIGNDAFLECNALESVTLPNGLREIPPGAFSICTSLRSITIPASVERIGGNIGQQGSIGNGAFEFCTKLEKVIIPGNSMLSRIGQRAFFSTLLGNGDNPIFIPDTVPSDIVTQTMVFPDTAWLIGSTNSPLVNWWALPSHDPLRKYTYVPDLSQMSLTPPYMYRFLPYQFTVSTGIPNNAGLDFSIVSGSLAGTGLSFYDGTGPNPNGFIPGTIYGSPIVTATPTINIRATSKDIPQFYAETGPITLTVAPRLTQPELENRYGDQFEKGTDSEGRIGDLIGGEYVITGYYADVEDQVMWLKPDFSTFVGLWINGVLKIQNTHYRVEPGSTKVTVYAQTIQELGNGEHTAAVGFSGGSGDNELVTVAQNFKVDLIDNPNPPYNPDPPVDPDPPESGSGGGGTGSTGSGGTGGTAGGGGTGGTTGGTAGTTGQGGTTPDENTAAQGSDNTTPGGSVTGYSGAITGPDGTPGGGFSFTLDGSGNPMEIGIDLPFEEFMGLYMNGQLMDHGTHYTARSGSTILSVSADYLDTHPEGDHMLTAEFHNDTVKIPFTLTKAQTPAAAEAPNLITDTSADASANTSGIVIWPFIVGGLAILLAVPAVIIWTRRAKSTAA